MNIKFGHNYILKHSYYLYQCMNEFNIIGNTYYMSQIVKYIFYNLKDIAFRF